MAPVGMMRFRKDFFMPLTARNRRVALLYVALLVPAARLVWAAEEAGQYAPPAEVRAAFLKLLDRPRVPLDPQTRSVEPDGDGRVFEQVSITSERKADGSIERVPLLVARPEKPAGKLPAVIVLHGTGGNKDAQRQILGQLARRGIIGVALDARYHGERAGGAKGAEAYFAAIIRAWKAPAGETHEHPFYFDTCWDIWRTIDYLQTRPDVDGERLGMIGFSMGGIQTWLAAAVDQRIKVAVPAISVQSFRWSLEHDAWQGRARSIQPAHAAAAADLGEPEVNARVCRELWNKVIPGMLDQFDCPSMIRLFAGRPLLVLSGDQDPNCPLEGAKIAFASAEAAYRQAGTSDRLKILVAERTAHKVTDDQSEAALGWLARWLAPEVRERGDWSEPVAGLRGRLLFGEGEKFNGTRMGIVYLELQNVSDVGNPMEIYFNIDRALPCELLDGDGKPVAQAGSPASIQTPLPYWIALPHDSSLRFRVSVTGYGVPRDGGLQIGMMAGDWRIAPTSHGDYFLASRFVVSPPKDPNRPHPWKGVLNLPKVKIPVDPP
jgi:dienelactone hydrolase